MAENQGDDDDVVELAGDGDEVGAISSDFPRKQQAFREVCSA
jgi:hypothetical protein